MSFNSVDDLAFQDFGVGESAKVFKVTENVDAGSRTYNFSHFPSDTIQQAVDAQQSNKQSQKSKFSFDYYQQLFDVDTDVVVRRLLYSMFPRPNTNYLLNFIRPNPDLYGPFWICATLVFTTAIAGNLSSYFASASSGFNFHWTLNFKYVTGAASAIFVYGWIWPALIYAYLWWRRSPSDYSYLELLTAYGYSLTVFIIVSLLWVYPAAWFQWILVCIAVVLSGSVLVFTLWPAVSHDNKLFAIVAISVIIGMHALLAVGFKELFFYSAGSVDFSAHPLAIATTDISLKSALSSALNETNG